MSSYFDSKRTMMKCEADSNNQRIYNVNKETSDNLITESSSVSPIQLIKTSTWFRCLVDSNRTMVPSKAATTMDIYNFLPDFTEHPKPIRRKKPIIESEDPVPPEEDELSFLHDFIAGGVAGSASVVVGHPFDT